MPSLATTTNMEYTCVRHVFVPNSQTCIDEESGEGGTDVLVPTAAQLIMTVDRPRQDMYGERCLRGDAACCGHKSSGRGKEQQYHIGLTPFPTPEQLSSQ